MKHVPIKAKYMSNVDLRVRVLLAVQASLLGAVTSNMRAVVCSWTTTQVNVQAIFDGPISSDNIETMSEIETEILSHFLGAEVCVRGIRIDQPSAIEAANGEVFVFKRSEG